MIGTIQATGLSPTFAMLRRARLELAALKLRLERETRVELATLCLGRIMTRGLVTLLL